VCSSSAAPPFRPHGDGDVVVCDFAKEKERRGREERIKQVKRGRDAHSRGHSEAIKQRVRAGSELDICV